MTLSYIKSWVQSCVCMYVCVCGMYVVYMVCAYDVFVSLYVCMYVSVCLSISVCISVWRCIYKYRQEEPLVSNASGSQVSYYVNLQDES